ncbi:hypothetical protein JCM10450v2_007588 [Rhodotorula kratochvilovae]
MEGAIYAQQAHTPAGVNRTWQWKEARRMHGISLDGKLTELNREIADLKQELTPIPPLPPMPTPLRTDSAPHGGTFGRPQTLTALQALQRSATEPVARTAGPAGLAEIVRNPRHADMDEEALSAELRKLELDRAKVNTSIAKLDPTGELVPIWMRMEQHARYPERWFRLSKLEEGVYEAQHRGEGGAPEGFHSVQPYQGESWRRTRREQGLWLEGRLDQLDTEIAQLEHELSLRGWDSPAHPAPHNFAMLHGSSAAAAQEERSLAHGRRMGWRAARRYFGEEYAGQGRGF